MNTLLSSDEIRRLFLDFFAQKQHTIVASSSLVPHQDATLLFTNAGMNQFKDVFLGFDKRAYSCASSSQKCVRAGGKHNDLENVGFTARHHTFFEMLGNFSFGAYFKLDAILYAWELLTVVFQIPADKLWVTVYEEDVDSYEIWRQKIGLAAERVIKIGDNKGERYASDNFWMMGDTGPCGPCTEIFYDHGDKISGGLPGSATQDGDRFIEIWNLVFMQFNRAADGAMSALPTPCVDTGMGLERITAVLQGVSSNYDIDIFRALIQSASRATQTNDLNHPSLKVLADHIRACGFLIADGVVPDNEGRGYVLRRIIRRAIRHGYKLGKQEPFFFTLVADLVKVMHLAYPELQSKQAEITAVLQQEELRFFETLMQGIRRLETELAQVGANKVLSGQLAFKLYDTFGFPLDLTQDVCREQGVVVDEVAFMLEMEQQQHRARSSGKFAMGKTLLYQAQETLFEGYALQENSAVHASEARVLALYQDGEAVSHLLEGQAGVVVLDKTPFYAESGGQVGDSGELIAQDSVFIVNDTQKVKAQVWGHHGEMRHGELHVGDMVSAQIDNIKRRAIMRHHSVTHLLHKALRQILGEHVQQKGSLVDAHKTRFDFTHNAALSDKQIYEVEQWVNAEILANTSTQERWLPLDQAKQSGAVMLFGEKYGDMVRVLDIGSSRELCGGTHVVRTGDIGLFSIVAENGIAAGVRRIEAVAGEVALKYVSHQREKLHQLAQMVQTPPESLVDKLAQLVAQHKALEKELGYLQNKLVASYGNTLVEQAVLLQDVSLIVKAVDSAVVKDLRALLDTLKEKLPKAIIVLASTNNLDKINLLVGVTANLTTRVSAHELVNFVAQQVGGRGGGKAEMAMAGGSDVSALPVAIASVEPWLNERLL